MRKIKLLVFLFAVSMLAGSLSAQTAKVTLTWAASTSSTATTPGTINVYRISGVCPTTPPTTTPAGFSLIATNIVAAGPYSDTITETTTPTTYCYFITAVIGGLESNPSNTFQAAIPSVPAQKPQPPTGLKGTVQ